MDIFHRPRKSKMVLDEVYFWTDSVKDWHKLFKLEKYKVLIIDILRELVKRGHIKVYAFVIMPNHLHIVWKLLKKNGKEMPHASFNKKTAHLIMKDLKENHKRVVPYFEVQETERMHRIWQRYPLAVLMDYKWKVEQKIDYIHNNPLQDHWNLAKYPEEYKWSSAKFYEEGIDEFDFLTDYREVF
ncbi:transposase [Bernardetia sp.]|uniref:transposase n=1 Tax=Bernardetia sp. TaxID=1937974 RepID=UPI0025B90972|nr:transposase [Bernardetia sp.]